ncbi:MAG: DUF4838 domain-containing protein [Clostridia bacterium]|nr:DUF4838 domain-containing protein [Clostridia bacterium]
MKRFINLILAFILLVCAVFSAVGCDNKSANTSNETFKETGEYLVMNGKSDYKIVSHTNESAEQFQAVNELQKLFKEGTGVTLPIIYEDEITVFNKSDKYIYVGASKFSKQNKITTSYESLTTSGYIIKTVGNGLFVQGYSDRGTLFGVYKLLGYLLDYDYYYIDYYTLDQNVKNLPLYKFNIKFRPDYEYNYVGAGYLSRGMYSYYSMAQRPVSSINGTISHSSIFWLPKDLFNNPLDPENYHPSWYMEAPGQEPTQLCYTARGDKNEFEAMAKEMAHQVAEEMIDSPNACYFDCSIADDFNWCECDGCNAALDKYGVKSALVVRLFNRVCECVQEWFDTPEGAPYEREWAMTFLAYNDLTPPPVIYNAEKDSFSTVDDSVFCNEHLIVNVADILATDYTRSFESDVNDETRVTYRGWNYLSKRMMAYLYSANYWVFLYPFDNISVLQSWYKAMQGNFSMYLLTHTHETGFSTGWSNLRLYLASKLGNDVDINVEEYIDKFFKNVYLDGATAMKTLFNEWRAHTAYWKENDSKYAGKMCHYSKRIISSKYYSASLLERWRSYIDQALDAVEYLKENQKLYAQVRKMIMGERIFIDYLYFEIYKLDRVYLPEDKYNEIRNELFSDIKFVGMTAMFEGANSSTDYYMENNGG